MSASVKPVAEAPGARASDARVGPPAQAPPGNRPGQEGRGESRHPFMLAQSTAASAAGPSSSGAEAAARASSAVPPGFEDLMQEQETLVDVYFAQQFLLSTSARYSPNTITFLEAGRIIERLPGLTEAHPVEQALSGELPANQELRCYYRGQTNCGVLEPEVAGVIFDSDRFRADIFVDPDFLVVQEAAVPRFLPPSTAGVSFLQNLSYAFAGDDGDLAEQSNLYSLSQLSWRENSVRLQANYSDQEDLDIDTLVGQRDFEGKRYQLGWFITDSQDLRFSPETDILGFRFGTALDTRADLRQSTGRQIEVFLQSRGEVSIFKDGRLLSTRIYDAGNQILDTSSLPGGAYDIELRIRDAGGERIERRFYVKNQRLPPADMPLYFFEIGEVTLPDPDAAMPEGTGEYLARGGANVRLDDGNAVFGGLGATEDDASAELGWIGLGRGYDLVVSGALAKEGRYGLNTEFRFNWRDLYLSGNYRRIWGNDGFDPGQLPLLGPEQEQASARLTIPAGRGRVDLAGRYNRRPGTDTIETTTIAYDLPIRLPGRSILNFRASYTHEDGDDFVFAGVRWGLTRGHWSYSAAPELAHEQADRATDTYWRGSASANWDSRTMWSSVLRGGVTTTHDRDFSTVGGNVDWGGRYGRARFQAEQVFRDEGEDSIRHNGNLATSLVATKGAAAVGGKDQNRAAIIIDVEGDPATDAFFEVLIDGTRQGAVRPGSRTLVTLTPFRTYRVRLKLQGADFIYFDDREHEVTLYPGNAAKLSWRADAVNIVFGRIIDERGEPISNALLKGVAGLSTTDEMGLFQAEIDTRARQIEVETRESHCIVALPEYQTRQGVGSVGTLRCDLEPKAAPPSGRASPSS